MQKTQKEYFQKGSLSESGYQIRSKNFADLVRDIDRQIPLLEEKLIKANVSPRNKDAKRKPEEEGQKEKSKKRNTKKSKK